MLRLVVFVAIATLASANNSTNPNTRLFGLGNVINGALGAVGGAIAGGLNGGLQGANPGFQPGFNRPPGFQNQVFPGQQFPGQQFPGQQFPGQGAFPGQQFPGQQFPGQQFPGQQFPGQGAFPGQQFPGQQFPGQQFPGQQFPIVPTGNIPVGAAIVNPGVSDNRPVVQGVSNSCRRWCKWRNEQGLLQNYCCEFANDPQTVAATKGGVCPPKRPSCPPTRFFTGPPVVCSSDGRCPGTDKCCPDACLQHHTCKPIQGTGK